MKTETIYELTCVLRGSLKPADNDKGVEEVDTLLAKLKAETESYASLGKQKLAYPIDKETEGYYHYWEITIPGKNIQKLELELERSEMIIRYLVIKKDTKTN